MWCRYKLLVSQPHFKSQNSGWKQPDGKWRAPNATEKPQCVGQDADPSASFLPVPAKGALPCLFDLDADPGEHHDISGDQFQRMVLVRYTR